MEQALDPVHLLPYTVQHYLESEWNHRVAWVKWPKPKLQLNTNRENYDLIYWIKAETEETILSGFREVAIRTPLSVQNPDDKLIAKLVLAWLHQQKNWLVVLDNLGDSTIVKGYLPKRGPDQHTLISTRSPNAHSIPARGLEIPLPTTEESIKMLCHLSGMDLKAHWIPAKSIVEEL